MRRWLVLLLIFVSTTAFASDTFIIPGVRVGSVTLGDSIQTLTHKVGAGQSFPSKDYTNLLYPGFTVVVSNNGRQIVQSVVVTDPPFHLKNGLGIGSSEQSVMKLLGHPSTVQAMGARTQGMIDKAIKYQKLGLFVNVAKSKVVQIGIYTPGGHP